MLYSEVNSIIAFFFFFFKEARILFASVDDFYFCCNVVFVFFKDGLEIFEPVLICKAWFTLRHRHKNKHKA